MKTSERDAALAVLERLRRHGFESYFVGGCVRDMLMGRASREHDIATAARPEEVAALFPRTRFVGSRFGVVLVVEAGRAVHVATFRSDMDYRDGRRPSAVRFSSAEEDVRRRDFTVNGLLHDPIGDRVIDHVGGGRDIEARVIRTIGDPAARFAEDRLRMLRAVRFAAALDFRIDEAALDAVRALAPGITAVSRERITEELSKIMTGERAGKGLSLLDRTGLLAVLLPEVSALKGVRRHEGGRPEGDAFEHTRAMLDLKGPSSRTLAFAVLLHDVGKGRPAAGSDRIRFHGRDAVGAEIAGEVCGRLRLPARVREAVVACVANRMAFPEVRKMREGALRRLIGRPTFPVELELHRLDRLAGGGDLSAWEFLVRKREEYGGGAAPAPLITGDDLIGLGFEEGPVVGAVLREVEEMQLDGRLGSRKEALEWARRRLE
ncbi:MAG: CCA tRNA nucleotidyltransferase [bacterium]|nr:CCA tRNA nucleotidyltransferase [bacterium]